MNISKLVYDFFLKIFHDLQRGSNENNPNSLPAPSSPHLVPLQGILPHALLPHVLRQLSSLSFPPRSTTSRQSSSLSSPLRSTTSRHSSSRSSPSRPRPCSFYSMYSYINHQLHFHALPPAPLLTERDPETRLPDLQ